MGSSGLSVWLNPTTPQGNPPKGMVDFSHSINAHDPANATGQPGSRRTAMANRPKSAGEQRFHGRQRQPRSGPTSPLIQGNNGT